ncbi:MAG: nicotinate-nucleotide--dimethylbenzimidazole phosphoribosyltransferase [Spirochaetes bacterium]|nr:nicotinate-nucleotide--dimethylbenzimidazole phosphoribosyltransferase [Spirochaetota bacterium]
MKAVLTALKKIEIRDGDPEEQVREGHSLLNVLCCAVCRTDAKMWQQGHRDLVFPRVLGHEMVAEDDAGSRYIVWPGSSCGKCVYCKTGRENLCEEMKISGFHSDGGFADHVLVPDSSLIPVSKSMDIAAGCFAEPVGCVVHAFDRLNLKQNDRVLIYGGGTMGLLTALYAKAHGLFPLIIEKSFEKINKAGGFLKRTEIECVKDTVESEYDAVINACADYIAFCQAITKTAKGGRISFFSGLTKNEHIETNLLNLVHYKEIELSGVYGMNKKDMVQAVNFIEKYQDDIKLLIEDTVPPVKIPELMEKVLSGDNFKYIIDVAGIYTGITQKKESVKQTVQPEKKTSIKYPDVSTLCGSVIKSIKPVDDSCRFSAIKKIDDKAKPLGALGKLEDLAVKISVIQKTLKPVINKKNIFVFAADHGITEEGVSAYPAEVTGQMVDNFLNGGAAINVLCRHYGIEMKIVDMGVDKEFSEHPDLIIKKVRKGTRSFAIENAMTYEEMIQALEGGMQVFLDAYEKEKTDIVGLGEMGIGNTSSSSAIISAVTGISPFQSAGRGTGVDDKGLDHKAKVILRALNFHKPDPENGFDVLQRVGGFEIAGIAGAVLAAASKQTTVVLDGVISTAAGLIAYLINPDIKGYLISAHKSVEAAQAAALSHMGLKSVIDLEMRLGEGTGAAMILDAADTACKIMSEMASFDEAKISRSRK